MFVNDNTLMHNTERPDTPATTLMTQIQHDAELWGCLLWIMGGLLEFLKSSYFIVIWVFKSDGKPMIETSLPPSTIKLTDAQGSTTKLKRVQPSNGIEMLGIQKAATLQETLEKAYLHMKAG
eukprot:4405903-Ditylum_brightwellii.AAC.2